MLSKLAALAITVTRRGVAGTQLDPKDVVWGVWGEVPAKDLVKTNTNSVLLGRKVIVLHPGTWN